MFEKGEKMKLINNIKNEKGSITLFVLVSIMFFVIVLVGLYINSSNRIQKQEKEIEDIQETYQKENIDDLYNKVVKNNTTYCQVVLRLGDGVNINNSIQKVEYGTSYSATLTLDSNYTIDEIEVMMGDEEIEVNRNDLEIQINNVTEDIIIEVKTTIVEE